MKVHLWNLIIFGWVTFYHNSSLESDTMECIWDFGKRLPRRLIGYWLGLQMAIEQLEKNKPAAEAVTL